MHDLRSSAFGRASTPPPKKNERTAEMLTRSDRQAVAQELKRLQPRYPKLLMNSGIARAIQEPPATPRECMFARMSTNYSADLRTRVKPCIFWQGAGLLAVRVCDQQRPALAKDGPCCSLGEDQYPGEQLCCSRFTCRKTAERLPHPSSLDNQACRTGAPACPN